MKTNTKLKIEGSWKEIKGKLKQKYAELTEDDLMYEEGQTDELLGRLQRKLGRSIDEIKEEINRL
ncbi:CsbD family protein [Algoriphagus confluentis]|uniref:CsbD family protein n=1 Tax=Algoriphagus confluentis TaxID=1697556 RepID=A0ABQ6PJP8_9BACT|nr:CsbD family protein [Algoriphagus confluentis]